MPEVQFAHYEPRCDRDGRLLGHRVVGPSDPGYAEWPPERCDTVGEARAKAALFRSLAAEGIQLPAHDAVNHPRHYTSHPSGIECIEITRHMGFNLGNAFKYIWRADLKHDDGGIEDLEKAAWYLQDEIARRRDSAAKN